MMLSDPNWGKTKTDPFSMESLIAWLEKQPADGVYDYALPFDCAAAQCLQSQGFSRIDSGLPVSRLDAIGWREVVRAHPRTFGAALERARAALKSPDHQSNASEN